MTLSLAVLECVKPLLLGWNNFDQNPLLFFPLLSISFCLWKTKAMDLLFLSISLPVLFKELMDPLTTDAARKLLPFTGDEYEEIFEDEDKDDKYEDDKDDTLLRDEELVDSLESFSLRQIEHTPGDWWCLGCFLQGTLALFLPDFRYFGLQDSILSFVNCMFAFSCKYI